jgi:hypothetical protein
MPRRQLCPTWLHVSPRTRTSDTCVSLEPSPKLFAYQHPAPSFLATVRRFPSEVERDVAILDHVPVSPDRSAVSSEAHFGDHTTTEDPLYLPPHGQSKENEKVHEQDGPVNRYVGGSGQGASQRDEGGLCSRKPEFELFALETNSPSAPSSETESVCGMRDQRGNSPGKRRMKGRNSSSSPGRKPLINPDRP